jgi:hypothetical protein
MQSDSTATCPTATTDYQLVASGTYAVAYVVPTAPTTCTAAR